MNVEHERGGWHGQGGVVKEAWAAILAALLVGLFAGDACAALPFFTDDAGTLGNGTSQVELWYEGFSDRKSVDGSEVKTSANLPGATFGYGVSEHLDLTLAALRGWNEETVDGVRSSDPGSAAFTLSAKWNIFEKREVYVTVKPLVAYTYRVGGTGGEHVTSYGGLLIVTREHGSLDVSLNAGYLFNDYGSASERDANRGNIWTLSALATYGITEGWKAGLELWTYTPADVARSEMPAYTQVGAIWSPAKNVDLGFGFKIGLTEAAADFAGIAGVTFRF